MKNDSIFDEKSAKQLMEAITKIPSLGVYGIIAAIIAIILMVGVWYWWNNFQAKAAQKETEEGRAKDQAETVPSNQAIEDQWQIAHGKIEDVRAQNPDAEKKPRPKPGT